VRQDHDRLAGGQAIVVGQERAARRQLDRVRIREQPWVAAHVGLEALRCGDRAVDAGADDPVARVAVVLLGPGGVDVHAGRADREVVAYAIELDREPELARLLVGAKRAL
jgi:hypothetical protein